MISVSTPETRISPEEFAADYDADHIHLDTSLSSYWSWCVWYRRHCDSKEEKQKIREDLESVIDLFIWDKVNLRLRELIE